MSGEEEEFVIGGILHCMEFDKLVEKALASEAVFNPESIKDGKSKHSKYAYLVHWQGFQLADRTWEPESNLKKTGAMAEYKVAHSMPQGHEKFQKIYGNSVWRNLMIAQERVKGVRYLMTPQEKREEKEKKERKEKLKMQNKMAEEKEKRRMEKRREKMTTPDDPEEIFKKKKNKGGSGSEDESPKPSQSFKIPKKKRSTSLERERPSSSTGKAKRVSDEAKVDFRKPNPIPLSSSSNNITETSSPRLQPLDLKTPKNILTLDKNLPITPSYDDDLTFFNPPRVQPTVTPEPMPDVTLISASSSRDALRNIINVPSPTRSCSTMSKCSTSEEEEVEVDEEALNKARREMEKLTTELKKFPIEMEVTRYSRGFPDALKLRKIRRCQSAENLNEFMNNGADLELFGRNFDASSRGETPAVIKVLPPPEPPFLQKKARVLTEQEEQQMYEDLVKENLARLEKIKHPFKYNMKTILPHLVTAYSRDDDARFKEIFIKNIPKRVEFDPHRYALVVFMISYFNHMKWVADPKGNTIVEADESKICGKIREHNPLCSKNHRKCTWLRLFMELVPSKLRFLESSEKNYNGRRGDDGPFRDDVYFHCMKLGAECQKRLFFEFHKPIGLQEDEVDEFRVDGMHLLAVQYGNLQRIASYMALGGADINALATHWTTKRVYRLHDYLKFWIDKNVTHGKFNNNHMSYYNDLVSMVRHTSESLECFVKSKVNEMIARRMNMMFKIHMDLTFPHIIRCSTINNESNCGDGAQQVLTCLFSPLGVGLRDGLPDKETPDEDKELKKLRGVLAKYQNLVTKKQGRLVLAMYRVEIEYVANMENGYKVPTFKHVASDDGYKVDEVNLLRQKENLPGDIAHIELIEHKALSSPGARYYVIVDEEKEKNLIVPGNAHIEIIGTFAESMSLVTQMFYIKSNY